MKNDIAFSHFLFSVLFEPENELLNTIAFTQNKHYFFQSIMSISTKEVMVVMIYRAKATDIHFRFG